MGQLVCVVLLAYGGWLNAETLASPVTRTTLAILPTLAARFDRVSAAINRDVRVPVFATSIALAVAFASCLLLSRSPVELIMFDEAHGPWESTTVDLGPDSFGRESLYSYSLLFDYAKSRVGKAARYQSEAEELPPPSTLFVIKTPVKPLSEAFVERMHQWVRSGGRLLLILDHTDLFGMTQLATPLSEGLAGVRVASDAVFDTRGMPTVHGALASARLRGRSDAFGGAVPYQTGASFDRIPWSSTTLATFGLSYGEPADYSTPNRFGPFLPSPSYRLSNGPSAIGAPIGRGAVIVLTDSTFLSNFALAYEPYQRFFSELVWASERPSALRFLPSLRFALMMCAILALLSGSAWGSLVTAVVVGLHAGASLQVGASFHTKAEWGSTPVAIGLGSEASLKFLPQLLLPSEENYARALSALPKYGITPTARRLAGEPPELEQSRRWLLLAPGTPELPAGAEIRDALKAGARVVVLLSQRQAGDSEVRQWLSGLGLQGQARRLLGLTEEPSRRLAHRNGGLRVFRYRMHFVEPRRFSDFSVYKDWNEVSEFRLGSAPGALVVGFASERFADLEIGDVWEGVDTSFLSRTREWQLAEIVLGTSLPRPAGSEFSFGEVEVGLGSDLLPRYAVFVDQALLEKGDLLDRTGSEGGRRPFTSRYLETLQRIALSSIASACDAEDAECESFVVGLDLVEWKVRGVRENGSWQMIELVHPRSLSGLDATYNIVFGQK